MVETNFFVDYYRGDKFYGGRNYFWIVDYFLFYIVKIFVIRLKRSGNVGDRQIYRVYHGPPFD